MVGTMRSWSDADALITALADAECAAARREYLRARRRESCRRADFFERLNKALQPNVLPPLRYGKTAGEAKETGIKLQERDLPRLTATTGWLDPAGSARANAA